MIINGTEKEVFVKNLRENPIYQHKDKINHGPVNYLIANNYKNEEISDFIRNAENVNLNYEVLEKESLDSGKDDISFKILGYFSLDSHKKELIHIGKKNKFHIELSDIPLTKENSSIIDMPFHAIVTLNKYKPSNNKDYINYKVENLEFVEAIDFDIADYKKLRNTFSTKEWFDLVITTLGYNPNKFTVFEKFNFLFRLIPYCTAKFHYLELGNKETGKSFFFFDLSERFSTLTAANEWTLSKLVYDNRSNQAGLIATRNIIGIDEIVDVNFKNKEIVPALQTYLQDGKVARDNHVIHGKASIVLLGNIKNVEYNLAKSISLFDEFKMEIANETFFDKFYYFSPGWKTGKIDSDNHCDDSKERLTLDFLINSLTKLRLEDSFYENIVDKFIQLEGTSSGRDKRIKRTIAGLLKILHPDGNVTQEEIEVYTYLAVCGRKLLLDQLNIKNKDEYINSLYASSKITNLEITANNYYNLSILLSEELFSEFDLDLSNVEYYYCDYTYFDQFNDGNCFNGFNAYGINKKLGFDLIEPRLAIKFKGDKNIYKLALSTYGINANVIEYDHSQKTQANNVDFLNNNFTLIKSENYTKPHNVHKLKYYANVFWDKLKEENKDNSTISTLISIIENNNKNLTSLLDENIELGEKIENLEIKLEKNQEQISQYQQQLTQITHNFNSHKHNLVFNYQNLIIGVGNIDSPPIIPIQRDTEVSWIPSIMPNFSSDETITIFDFEQIQALKVKYI